MVNYFSLASSKMSWYSWRDILNSFLHKLSNNSFTETISFFSFALSNIPKTPVYFSRSDSAIALAAISSNIIRSAFNSKANPRVSLSPGPRSIDNISTDKCWLRDFVLIHVIFARLILLLCSKRISFLPLLG